jgi:NitT/TauT family transport system ATP-binding protein
MSSLLSLAQISYGWPGTPVFRDLSLSVQAGELLVVLGPSGCGKTTLLTVAAGMVQPQAGAVVFQGRRNPPPGPERLLVFQDSQQLLPWKTAAGNIDFALRATRRGDTPGWRSDDRDRGAIVAGALAEVELATAAGKYPHQLSGGMRQRVALARAFAIAAPVLLLDEPFAAVDAPTRRRLGDLLRSLQDRHAPAVLFVTHDVEEALRLGDRIVVLDRQGVPRLNTTELQSPETRAAISEVLQG